MLPLFWMSLWEKGKEKKVRKRSNLVSKRKQARTSLGVWRLIKTELPIQGALARPLVRELRSHMLHSEAPPKKWKSKPPAPATVEICPHISAGWWPQPQPQHVPVKPASQVQLQLRPLLEPKRDRVGGPQPITQRLARPSLGRSGLDPHCRGGPFPTTPRSPASDSLLHFLLRCSVLTTGSQDLCKFLFPTRLQSILGKSPSLDTLSFPRGPNPVPCTLQLSNEGVSTLKACCCQFTTRQIYTNTDI